MIEVRLTSMQERQELSDILFIVLSAVMPAEWIKPPMGESIAFIISEEAEGEVMSIGAVLKPREDAALKSEEGWSTITMSEYISESFSLFEISRPMPRAPPVTTQILLVGFTRGSGCCLITWPFTKAERSERKKEESWDDGAEAVDVRPRLTVQPLAPSSLESERTRPCL
jgi:hypothetical protein